MPFRRSRANGGRDCRRERKDFRNQCRKFGKRGGGKRDICERFCIGSSDERAERAKQRLGGSGFGNGRPKRTDGGGNVFVRLAVKDFTRDGLL